MNKLQAKNRLAKLGYTLHFSTGSAGDGRHGSREYYCRPDAEKGLGGWPIEHATVSKIGREWHVSIFQVKPFEEKQS